MKIFDKLKKAFESNKIKSFFQKILLLIKKIKLRWIVTTVVCLSIIAASAAVAVFTVSLSIKAKTAPSILSVKDSEGFKNVDSIIVLGAGLRSDGTPSDMLADRLTVGIALLEKHPNAKLILTGDNSGDHYNEVASMKKYVMDRGVSEDRIIEDGLGYSTYESIYRAKHEFKTEKAIIVTQKYHLHRVLYIASQMDIDVIGVSADLRGYRKQFYREVREHMARFKDFFYTLTEYVPQKS